MYQILLASASPRRRDILEQIGAKFTIAVSQWEEVMTDEASPLQVRRLSAGKAEEVASKLRFCDPAECDVSKNDPELFYIDGKDAVIIGADTVVALNGKVLGKPKSEAEADEMLEALSGTTHQVYTGVCLLIFEGGELIEEISFAERTDVSVYSLSPEERTAYIATGEPMDKAGAYGIQGLFAPYIAGLDGDYYNVVGLPVAKIFQELKSRGIDLRTGKKLF